MYLLNKETLYSLSPQTTTTASSSITRIGNSIDAIELLLSKSLKNAHKYLPRILDS